MWISLNISIGFQVKRPCKAKIWHAEFSCGLTVFSTVWQHTMRHFQCLLLLFYCSWRCAFCVGPKRAEPRPFLQPWKGGEGSGWDRLQSPLASQGTATQTPSDKGNQYHSRRRALAWHRISNEQKASSCLKITPWALYQSSPHLMQASAEGIFPSRPSTSFSNIYCLRSVVYTIYRTCQG